MLALTISHEAVVCSKLVWIHASVYLLSKSIELNRTYMEVIMQNGEASQAMQTTNHSATWHDCATVHGHYGS